MQHAVVGRSAYEFQVYFRKHKPPFLAAWARTTIFPAAGGRGVQRDIPDADVCFFDTGHFALEPHCDEIAAAIRNFLSRSK
jgi:pimeloyl-ACP methyl ester carboxylesterase